MSYAVQIYNDFVCLTSFQYVTRGVVIQTVKHNAYIRFISGTVNPTRQNSSSLEFHVRFNH